MPRQIWLWSLKLRRALTPSKRKSFRPPEGAWVLMLDAGTALISMGDPEGNGPGHLDILETELGRAYCRRTFKVTAGVPKGAAQARSGSGY